MQVSVRWCDWDGNGLEHCVLDQGAGGLVLEGVVAGTRGGQYGARYLVRTDAQFRTREVRVSYVAGPDMHIESDGEGHWHDKIANGALSFLDGCFDVDIGITPATNMLPIKRLNLHEQQSRDISVAYVPLPHEVDDDFLPRYAKQRYTCLIAGKRYRYDGIFRAFSAELEFDEHGLVCDYPDTFRRVED